MRGDVGTYYLNVIGYCSDNSECTDECTCAPCTNLLNSSYALLVNYSTNSYEDNLDNYMGTCSGPSSICSSVCATDDTGNSDDNNSGGRKVTISVITAVLVFACFVAILTFFYYRRKKVN